MGGTGMAGGHLEWDPQEQRWVPPGRRTRPLVPRGVGPSGPGGPR
ncbi:hypothetical protein HDA36_006237 [Nocardiopsis composta]|uniref:Uncharacterized protein n=1 Tax=Nocardiopsis composta TaxID=157465 RepID=A0A7W8VHJ1_9ACTN|nr:hypothetical protein [Nocardiopsis composta]